MNTSSFIIHLALLSILLVIFNCSNSTPEAQIEIVTTSQCWVSPCWGTNAPKIVRNSAGQIWAVGLSGSYPDANTQLFKRIDDNTWQPGKIFEKTYQPSQICLDNEGYLNVITNSQTSPVKHYRSTDIENLQNFELIASGNGQDDGRGWYVGVGISDNRIYMAYITLDYDFWLTWKEIQDSTWHPPVLVYDGFPDPGGNHALLYPKFYFSKNKGYILASHCSDGSTYNFKDKVFLITFSPEQPEDFSIDHVYEGHKGYGAFGYDLLVNNEGTIFCAYHAGKHYYGHEIEDAVAPGIYISVKKSEKDDWEQFQIHDSVGNVALFSGKGGDIYALINEGDWENTQRIMLKKSVDDGERWEMLNENILSPNSEMKHPNNFQTINMANGSTVNGLQALFSNRHPEKTADSLYTFDLIFLQLNIN
ncbi:hypothetical protein JW964_14115 [candidate division KSB1 bacterium]|nr:hypothetical protein [candidate division KSB1 bacterium]